MGCQHGEQQSQGGGDRKEFLILTKRRVLEQRLCPILLCIRQGVIGCPTISWCSNDLSSAGDTQVMVMLDKHIYYINAPVLQPFLSGCL